MTQELILTICAHNDDQIIGAGGALAKYSGEGKIVKTIIFSFGEKSHPYLKPKVIIQKRIDESVIADKIMGGKGIAYYGLKDTKFEEEFKKHKIKEKIKKLLQTEKPKKVFTHSNDDVHPDHQAVNKLIKKVIEELKKEKKYIPEMYTFQVWHVMKTKKNNNPKLIIDITDTFDTKIKSLNAHKSQKVAIITLLWTVYFKAILNGILHGFKKAEVFDKIA